MGAGLGGVGRALPVTVFALGLSGLSLMGLPPSGGFAAKWLLTLASIQSGQWWWGVVMLLGGLFTGAYMFRILAQALGGRVAKSLDGWGAGLHRYEFFGDVPAWMDPPPQGGVRIIASHQDQVTELPEGAVLLARTDHCPVAAYALGSSAFAIQPHPEFTAAVSKGLVERRRERIGAEASDAALASLDESLDRDVLASWMAGFLRHVQP